MGYVYKITNTINNKSYIGISIYEPEKGRIEDHLSGRGNRIIANAVEKYGKDAFTYEILEENVFDELLRDLEVVYIANYNTVAPHGYNLTHGGGGTGKHSEVSRRKNSEAHKGKRLSPEHRRKISEGNRGKTMSAKARRKMSESKKGENNPSFGKKPHNFGKSHSENTRRKMSESKKNNRKVAEHLRNLAESNRLPEYANAYNFFFSLHPDIPRSEKTRLLSTYFPNVTKRTIRRWVQKWEQGFPKSYHYGKRHPDYVHARTFFLSLGTDIPLREKRKSLYTKFPNVSGSTMRKWTREWAS